MSREQVIKKAKENAVELVRFVYVDNDGVIRGYNSTPEELEGDLESGHPLKLKNPLPTSTVSAGSGYVLPL